MHHLINVIFVNQLLLFFSGTFINLQCFEKSLQMDQLLQTSLAFLMKPRHFPIAMGSGSFEDTLLLKMMVRYMKESHISTNRVSKKPRKVTIVSFLLFSNR